MPSSWGLLQDEVQDTQYWYVDSLEMIPNLPTHAESVSKWDHSRMFETLPQRGQNSIALAQLYIFRMTLAACKGDMRTCELGHKGGPVDQKMQSQTGKGCTLPPQSTRRHPRAKTGHGILTDTTLSFLTLSVYESWCTVMPTRRNPQGRVRPLPFQQHHEDPHQHARQTCCVSTRRLLSLSLHQYNLICFQSCTIR